MPSRLGSHRRSRPACRRNPRRVAGNEFRPPAFPLPRHGGQRWQGDGRRLSLRRRQKEEMKYDVVIVGGGIVGLATTFRLLEANPQLKILLVEKESKLAAHQTGN